MNINPIQSNMNFEAKQKFLTKNQYSKMRILLEKMNSETTYFESKNGSVFSSDILARLIMKDKEKPVFFIDKRCLLKKQPQNKQTLWGETTISFNNVELNIDNKTGEIVSNKKPFFTTWNQIMKKINKYFQIFIENYNNPELISKQKFNVAGLTQKGYNELEEVVNKISTKKRTIAFINKNNKIIGTLKHD